MYGREITEEHHAIDKEGMRYFGLMSLRSTTGYCDTVGLRNSNDRSFPVGIGFGPRVFVCSNLAFVANHVIKRRHKETTDMTKTRIKSLLLGQIDREWSFYDAETGNRVGLVYKTKIEALVKYEGYSRECGWE